MSGVICDVCGLEYDPRGFEKAAAGDVAASRLESARLSVEEWADRVHAWVDAGYPDLDDPEERQRFMSDVHRLGYASSGLQMLRRELQQSGEDADDGLNEG